MTGQKLTSKNLRAARALFGADAERRKRDFLAAALVNPPRPQALPALHDDLLFLRAFPGDPETLGLAVEALEKVETWRGVRALGDSGVAGSKTRNEMPLPILRSLLKSEEGRIEVDWRNYARSERLDPILKLILSRLEREAFEAGDKTAHDWVKLARGRSAPTDLHWIIGALDALLLPAAAVDELWAGAEAPVVWDLAGSRRSTTRNILRLPIAWRRSFRRPPVDAAARIAAPIDAIELLKPARARAVIDLAQAALSSRCREVYPTSHANPREVYWCDLGEGIALAVIGALPGRRLCLEANYGYLLVSNGVPIGYGGVTALYRQANTGINIFEPFRGAEAGFLWVEMLRVFATLFGARRFIVNGYQIGEGNPEAIASGAFWFYYRLGFRQVGLKRRRLAAREFKRRAAPGAKRTDRATLKELARGDVVLDLPGWDELDAFDEALLVKAGEGVARVLAEENEPSRRRAEEKLAMKLASDLGVRSMGAWPSAERDAFGALAPLAALLPDLQSWNRKDREALVLLMRAKGRPQERDFIKAGSARLYRTLARTLGSTAPLQPQDDQNQAPRRRGENPSSHGRRPR